MLMEFDVREQSMYFDISKTVFILLFPVLFWFVLFVPDPDLFLKSARLQRLPSSASDLASQDLASLRETVTDPFTEGCACQRDGLTVIITACLTFATGVTVALIMQIYFGDPQVRVYVCDLQLYAYSQVAKVLLCQIITDDYEIISKHAY